MREALAAPWGPAMQCPGVACLFNPDSAGADGQATRREEVMITHLPGLPLPTESTLDINIRVTQPLNITSFSARQRVTQHVMHALSTQLGADTPELTVGERVYWSVPVVFTLPGKGVLGRVGTLRVDAGTGDLLTDPQTEREIMQHAEQFSRLA